MHNLHDTECAWLWPRLFTPNRSYLLAILPKLTNIGLAAQHTYPIAPLHFAAKCSWAPGPPQDSLMYRAVTLMLPVQHLCDA